MTTLGEERRAKLVMDLKNLKKEAPEYDVFISRTNRLDIEPYAVVSTGKSILFIQFAECSTRYMPVYEYMPSSKNGSGCMIYSLDEKNLPTEITKEKVGKWAAKGKRIACQYGVKKFWFNTDAFMQHQGRAERYEAIA